jgi:Na+/H+ antiporter NhaB
MFSYKIYFAKKLFLFIFSEIKAEVRARNSLKCNQNEF